VNIKINSPMISDAKRKMSTMPTPLTAMSAAGFASASMHTTNTPIPANVRLVTSSSVKIASCCQYNKKWLNVNTLKPGMLTPFAAYGLNASFTSGPVNTRAMTSSNRMVSS